LAGGAIDEARALMQLGLDPDLPVMRALGVVPLTDLVAGRIEEGEAAERAKSETRQYAKRQLTWLRRNMITWKWTQTQETEKYVSEF
jgi:tRNA dimethylallyltransferase